MKYAAIFLAVTAYAQQICDPTPLYSPCELVFELNSGEATNVEIRAEVKSPKFKTAIIQAFEENSNRWIIRFSPTEAGEYQFRITSNLPRFQGKIGSVSTLPTEHPGFIRPANVRHWWYPDSLKPHLWTGAACLDCFTIPRTEFEQRVAQLTDAGVNHLRIRLAMEEAGPNERNREIDARLHALGEKRVIADLILAETPGDLASRYPGWRERARFAEYVATRFSAYDVTWLIFRDWEEGKQGRAMAKEIGTILKKSDPNNHPRSTGARMTSASLLADEWMDYINIGATEESLSLVEREFFGRPFVSIASLTGSSEEVRKRFWRLMMTGAYPSMDGVPLELLKQWNELLSRTRFWELDPWFNLDGGRALALNSVEYLVYIEKPSGPIEVSMEKHGYQVYWIDPSSGQLTKAKDFRGEKFVGEPPDMSHDWILHLSRDGRKEGMLKSFKFESKPPLMQEIEYDPAKVPFTIVHPSEEELSVGRPVKYELKITRETRATRDMHFVWTADVVADGQGYRVFGIGRGGTGNLPPDLATKFPGVLNVRLSAINANGKAYALDRVYTIVR
jgi:hypothetical protein